jgi:hypothetical protein
MLGKACQFSPHESTNLLNGAQFSPAVDSKRIPPQYVQFPSNWHQTTKSIQLFGAMESVAPCLLILRNIKVNKGAFHENSNCHDVQKNSRASDPTAGLHL